MVDFISRYDIGASTFPQDSESESDSDDENEEHQLKINNKSTSSPVSSRDSGCGDSPENFNVPVTLRTADGNHLAVAKARPQSLRSETSSRSSGEHDEDIIREDVHISTGPDFSVIELPPSTPTTCSSSSPTHKTSPTNRVSIMVPSAGQKANADDKSPLLTTDDKLYTIGSELLETEEHYVKELYLIDQVSD